METSTSQKIWPRLGIAPGRVCRVFGMRRSGNHAIINWLARNAPEGRSVFFNDCAVGKSPFDSFRAIEVNGARAANAEADPAQFAQQAGDGAALFFSYEDAMPNMPRKRAISKGVDGREITTEIVICRDFLNWSASLLKMIQGNPGYVASKRIAIMMRAIETYGLMLDLALRPAPNMTVIHYGPWFSDSTYRKRVLDKLGFPERDDTLGDVQSYGNGSSFQPTANAPSDLKPTSRWKAMAEDPEYKIILWLAAQDASLRAKLSRMYPGNTQKLTQIGQMPPMPGSIL